MVRRRVIASRTFVEAGFSSPFCSQKEQDTAQDVAEEGNVFDLIDGGVT